MSTDPDILRHRIGVATIVSAGSLTSSQVLDIQNRLTAVEAKADTINPYPIAVNEFASTASHGLGSPRNQVNGIVQPQWVVWVDIWVPQPFTSNAMSVWVSTAAAGGQLTLARYTAAGALARTYGTVNTDTTGVKFATLGTAETVPAGRVVLAVRANNVSNIWVVMHQTNRWLAHTSTLDHIGARFASGQGSLPATIPATTNLYEIPWLGIKRSA